MSPGLGTRTKGGILELSSDSVDNTEKKRAVLGCEEREGSVRLTSVAATVSDMRESKV